MCNFDQHNLGHNFSCVFYAEYTRHSYTQVSTKLIYSWIRPPNIFGSIRLPWKSAFWIVVFIRPRTPINITSIIRDQATQKQANIFTHTCDSASIWKTKFSNEQLFYVCEMQYTEAILFQSQLRWADRVMQIFENSNIQSASWLSA